MLHRQDNDSITGLITGYIRSDTTFVRLRVSGDTHLFSQCALTSELCHDERARRRHTAALRMLHSWMHTHDTGWPGMQARTNRLNCVAVACACSPGHWTASSWRVELLAPHGCNTPKQSLPWPPRTTWVATSGSQPQNDTHPVRACRCPLRCSLATCQAARLCETAHGSSVSSAAAARQRA